MEQTAEQRRERLRAMRDAASEAEKNADATVSHPVLPPPPMSDLPELSLHSASPRFEYYTDPLAPFSHPHRKFKSAAVSDQLNPPHPQFSWQPRFNPNPNPSTHANHSQPSNVPLPDSRLAPNCNANPRAPGYYYSNVNTTRPPSHWTPRSPNRPIMYHNDSSRSPNNSFRGRNATDNRASSRRGKGRGTQMSSTTVSAITNPELFAKRSMLMDPWKDLVPVCVDSVQSHSDSNDWLPKSISKKLKPSDEQPSLASAAGPSLANHLASSFADAMYHDNTIQ